MSVALDPLVPLIRSLPELVGSDECSQSPPGRETKREGLNRSITGQSHPFSHPLSL